VIDDGGSAFPVIRELEPYLDEFNRVGYSPICAAGMSLRDYFAGQALSGFVQSARRAGAHIDNRNDMARWSYEQADAMIKARESE